MLIPARFASERFPGKMLVDRTGKTLIQHTYERAASASGVGRVVVATDDRRILDAVEGFGGRAVMTRDDHPNGTSRIAEVAATFDDELIVNVQGDEPEMDPGYIDQLIALMVERPELPMGTLACPFTDVGQVTGSSCNKVIVDRLGDAIYFSRSVIPFNRAAGGKVLDPGDYLLHLGIYAYRRDFLLKYVELPPTPLERAEALEQLRAIEHGYRIGVRLVSGASIGIDTPEEYEAFVRRQAGKAGE